MSAANDSARARITSAGTFRAMAAAIAARVFSTWKETCPPRVNGTRFKRQECLFPRTFGHDDRVVANEDRLPPDVAVPHDHRMIAVQGEVADPAGRIRRHGHAVRIVGVQDGSAVGRHDVDDAALHLGQGLDRVDFVQAEVVALADVGHHRHVAASRRPGLRGGCRRGPFRSTAASTDGFMSTARRSAARRSRPCRCGGCRRRCRRCRSCRRGGPCRGGCAR